VNPNPRTRRAGVLAPQLLGLFCLSPHPYSEIDMTAPLKVLCVDDNPDAADSTAEMLRLAGFDTRSCHDVTSALAEAEVFEPDVCVLDLTMPGMSGDQLGKVLREWVGVKDVRLIALTGRWDIEAHHRTHNAGFDEHLVKPVDPAKLIAAVKGAKAVA
jgi:two-component system, OmpR family, response regulator